MPDTYVKLSLVSSSGQEISHSKTSIRRAQPNPLFKETFTFQVCPFTNVKLARIARVCIKEKKNTVKFVVKIQQINSGRVFMIDSRPCFISLISRIYFVVSKVLLILIYQN